MAKAKTITPSLVSPLPKEIVELPHWVNHIDKRPFYNGTWISPDAWASANSYETVKQQSPHIGILVAPASEHPYLFLDIDFPGTKEEKADLQNKLANVEIGSEEHLELIEPTLASIRDTELYPLIQETYTEFSPSLTGLRMIVQSQDKSRFTKAYKKTSNGTVKGQIDFRDQFITITELQYPGSPSTIKEVNLLDLKTFNFQNKQTPQIETVTVDTDTSNVELPFVEEDFSDGRPTLAQLVKALKVIPIDQNERIKKVWKDITGENYEHYHFWLSIGMALHSYSTRSADSSKIYLEYLEWSKKDAIAYTSEEDVYKKWQSFSSDSNDNYGKITWRTILKLANRLHFDYPRPVLNKNGIPTANPQPTEWVNFEYLLNYYNIKLHEDNGFYISGDSDVCTKFFLPQGAQVWFKKFYGPMNLATLNACVLQLCQDSKYKGINSMSAMVNVWITKPREDMDMFKLWLDTPYEELPSNLTQIHTQHGTRDASEFNNNSTLDYVFKCLNVQYTNEGEIALARQMLKCTLMQFIKFRENLALPFTDNGGMFILLGAENTYKSTFFKLLLPQAMSNLRKEVNMQIKGEKGVRDFLRYLGNKAIVQIDEFEGLMDQQNQGSLFKALISGDNVSMTDIYQTEDTQMQRKAVIVGTSNEMRQVLSDNGSRRMWFVKVNKIDTKAMLQINLHKLYNDLRDEFRRAVALGQFPWLLNQKEINQLYLMNEGLTAKNELTTILEEIWPYGEAVDTTDYLKDCNNIQACNNLKLMGTREIFNAIMQRSSLANHIKMPALERALERYCSKFTNTTGITKWSVRPKGTINNGRFLQGELPNGKYKYAKWIMPPMTKLEIDEELNDD